MEYIRVRFLESRIVLVDGQTQGQTNQILQLSRGTYTVSLSPNSDVTPSSRTVVLEKTNPLKPLEVLFEKTVA